MEHWNLERKGAPAGQSVAARLEGDKDERNQDTQVTESKLSLSRAQRWHSQALGYTSCG